MLPNVKLCLYPRDPAEAVRQLQEHGRQALVVAGGTSASLVKDPQVTTLVDITRMGLDTIEQHPDRWSLGCNVRIQQIASHPGIASLVHGMLGQAARSVGCRAIRNAATVGGNVVQLFRWSDSPVALLAMDASFELLGPKGTRTLGADDFFARHPKQLLEAAEILVRIHLRVPEEKCTGAFIKYSRTAFDLAVVDSAVYLSFQNNQCVKARVVVGGAKTLVWRAREAEKILEGKRLRPEIVAAAARAAREATVTAQDIRTSKEYRERMVEVVVGRALEKAVALSKE